MPEVLYFRRIKVQKTIFGNSFLRGALKNFSDLLITLFGWKIECPKDFKKGNCVLIAVPHTTWLDLPTSLLFAFSMGLTIRWVGKESLFKYPFGNILKYLGGIPVDRSGGNGFVDEAAKILTESLSPFQLVIAPEGTRKKSAGWKTGFYHIARKADVPIVTAILSYKKRKVCFHIIEGLTGEADKDIQKIRKLVSELTG